MTTRPRRIRARCPAWWRNPEGVYPSQKLPGTHGPEGRRPRKGMGGGPPCGRGGGDNQTNQGTSVHLYCTLLKVLCGVMRTSRLYIFIQRTTL
eukprot:scaffold3455_cov62-Phaeocystis_antarctica.AAC.4